MSVSSMNTNKPEAARRQTDMAIRLFFEEEDPIGIHTLAAAAGRILRDLCEKKESTKNYHTLVKTLETEPNLKSDFFQALTKAANFYKHANRDTDEVLDGIKEEMNECLLIMNCLHYADLGYNLTPEMNFFQAWVIISNPESIKQTAFKKNYIETLHFFESQGFHKKPRDIRIRKGRQMLLDTIPILRSGSF